MPRFFEGGVMGDRLGGVPARMSLVTILFATLFSIQTATATDCGQIVINDQALITQDKKCPGPSQGQIKVDKFHFSYEAWVRKHPIAESYLYGRCVQNALSKVIRVRWGDLCCWINKKDTAKIYVPSPGSNCEVINGELLYGARPFRVSSHYFRPLHWEPGTIPIKYYGVPTYVVAPLRTYVRIAIPTDDQNNEERTFKTVELFFESGIISEDDVYYFRYELGLIANDPVSVEQILALGIEMRSQSPALTALFQGKSEDKFQVLTTTYSAGGYRVEGSEILLFSKNGQFLASFPVTYYVTKNAI